MSESPAKSSQDNRPVPLYRQVRDSVARDIRERNLPPHTLYLSESQAMEKFGVSRVTIRQAFQLLEDEALLYRVQGKGSYVAPPPVEAAKTVAFLATCVLRSGVETIMLRSIEEYFDHRDVNLIICNHEDSFTRAERYVKRLVQWGVDGIVYMPVTSSVGYEKNVELIEHAMENRIPVIQIDRYLDELEGRVVSIRPDNVGGCRALTEHLIKLGHKRIAFCGTRWSSATRDRLDGCRQALEAAGLELRREYQLDILTERDFRTVAVQFASMARRPTAVVCITDEAALRLIACLEEAGLRVPRDIAVVGFDDYSPVTDPSHRLTTVRVGHWEEGRIAATAMVEQLRGNRAETAPVIVPVELVVRDSCAYRPEMETTGPVRATGGKVASGVS